MFDVRYFQSYFLYYFLGASLIFDPECDRSECGGVAKEYSARKIWANKKTVKCHFLMYDYSRRLLDPEDVDTDKPDEKSIITYVSTLYQNMPCLPDKVR